MFPKYEPDANADHPAAAGDTSQRLKLRTAQLQRTLMSAPNLRAADAGLRQHGRQAAPSAQLDAVKDEISALERLVSFDPDLQQSPEAKAVLGQARACDPVIADINALENDGPMAVHESGIMNLTAEHSLPVPEALADGGRIMEGLGHALGNADGHLAHPVSPAAAKLRNAIGEPSRDDELDVVLAPHEACAEAARPE